MILARSPAVQTLTGEPRRLVAGWAERGWPVVVRRRGPDDGDAGIDAGIDVGIPLPPSCGKLRLALSVPADWVAEPVAAVPLSRAVGTTPAHWRTQLEELVAFGERQALRPALFGALLWQQVTGLPYLRPGSDIDLVWPTPPAGTLGVLLDTLERLDAAGPARLDGEIILADGGGVNWRELHRELRVPDGAVLVKSMDGADIRCARTLFT
ncbi:malonate decarboxylase holo-[acyl-carrier-protein] synthase [Azospirillum rugosum]|uniref:malonate decarboxylase holo-[acyl-carrier-protein] synthase n=1 Tax=Azospirillum rugosum TaxID=416170 RepID=UPI0031B802EC